MRWGVSRGLDTVFFGGLFWILFFWGSAFGILVEDEAFLVSNYPEAVGVPGLVFSETMDRQSLRVLYHHKNVTDRALYISVLVMNPSAVPARFKLQKGLGGSSEDVVFAGHKAARDFVSESLNIPEIVQVKPFSSVQVIMHKMKSNQTSSGIFRVQKLYGDNLTVKMAVVDNQFPQLTAFSDIPSVLSQFRVAQFDESSRKKEEVFNCKHKIAAIEVGGPPYLMDKQRQYQLKGNYGLIYDINVILHNPFNNHQQIDLFLAPKKKGGVDRGVIVVNQSEVKEIGLLRYQESQLVMEKFHSVSLNPLETKQLQLLTFPQSGCYYPVDIILKAQGTI